jgi:hypothetical protein
MRFVWLSALASALGLLAAPLAAGAQPPASRIGFVMSNTPVAISDRLEAFRQGLRDLGYVEGKNIVVEYRGAGGKIERLPDLIAELCASEGRGDRHRRSHGDARHSGGDFDDSHRHGV